MLSAATKAVFCAARSVRLSDLRGKPVVLYVYPRDDTPDPN
jgi:peroxiredoxin